MRMTLLEMVQNIASAMESDDVNSISDTVESYQIALVIKETYDEVTALLKIPSKQSLILLTGLADTTKPTHLKIPDTVKQIDWIKYDYQQNSSTGDYQTITYLEPEEFIIRTRNNSPITGSSVISDYSGALLTILTTQYPTYWTTFDNTYIVMDSYLNTVDTTLQSSKTLSWGQLANTFTLSDGYVPLLDDDLFPLLLSEAKSTCFQNNKQIPAPKEEQRAHRQLTRAQNDLWRANQRKPYDKSTNYGRRR